MSTEKPTCAVNGMLGPRAMCGSVIVGLKYCGHKGECEHKIAPPPAPAANQEQKKD